jgi:surfeit locus 1 family protein
VRASRSALPWRRLIGPALTTLIFLLILIGLGTWQVYRLHWKEGILAQIAASESGPAVPLGPHPSPYSKVAVTGRLLSDNTVWYGADVRDTPGGEPRMGYFQLVPMIREGQKPVLVLRGWVPQEPVAPTQNPAGAVAIDGYVRDAEREGWFSPANDVAGRHFYTLEPQAIANAMGIGEVAPIVIVALGPTVANVYPAPAQHLPQPPNNHLSYAITWYGLAVALVVIFVIWARDRLRA